MAAAAFTNLSPSHSCQKARLLGTCSAVKEKESKAKGGAWDTRSACLRCTKEAVQAFDRAGDTGQPGLGHEVGPTPNAKLTQLQNTHQLTKNKKNSASRYQNKAKPNTLPLWWGGRVPYKKSLVRRQPFLFCEKNAAGSSKRKRGRGSVSPR